MLSIEMRHVLSRTRMAFVAFVLVAHTPPTSAAPLERWTLRIGMDDAAYRAALHEKKAAGLHVIDQAVYDAGDGTPRYAALWHAEEMDAPAVRWGLGANDFHRASIDLSGGGYRSADIVVGIVAGGPLYSGRWIRPADRRHGTRYWQSAAEMRRALRSGGMRITAIAPFVANRRLYLASAYEDGPGMPGLVDASEETMRRIDRRHRANGLTLVQLRAWRWGGRLRYVALWDRSSRPAAPQIVQAPLSQIVELERGLRSRGQVPRGFSILPGPVPAILIWTRAD